jgi:hypothetical protein
MNFQSLLGSLFGGAKGAGQSSTSAAAATSSNSGTSAINDLSTLLPWIVGGFGILLIAILATRKKS